MNLIRAAAAGRPVQAGPRLLFLSPPSLRGLATILAFLQGRVPPPEDAGPGWLPGLASEPAFAEYATPAGAALLMYVTARRDHPDLTIEEAARLVAEMDDDAIGAMVRVAFVRQGSGGTARTRDPDADDDRPPCGIESFDFGRIFESDAVKRFPPQTLSEMSMDQFENAVMAGESEPDDALTFDEVMAIYEAYRPKKDGD